MMKLEYNPDKCTSFHLCVPEWEAITEGENGSKIDISQSEKKDGVYKRHIPEEELESAKAAAEACPVNAIKIYDEDGNQIAP